MKARNPGLEAARALAMLLVIATHAALSFMVTPIGWAIQDRSQNLGVDLGVWIARAFAMPTFMWLSGYFSRALLVDGGVRAFIRNRMYRIALPLVLMLVPCALVLARLWAWGRELSDRAPVAANIPRLQTSELPIVLGHLWFLYYLLWLSAAAFVLSRRVRAPVRLPTLAVPIVITSGVLVGIGQLHTNTPMGFIPDPAIFAYMGAFFAWGWLVHARPDELATYGRHARHALAVAPLLLAPVVVALSRGEAPIYAILASALFSIAVMIGFLGLCARHVTRRHPLIRAASDASYWCYIVHLPIVVLLQIVLADVAIFGPVKYIAIVITAGLLSFGSHAAVRWARR
jgi:glucan biosynthesis protein C